MGDFCRLSLTEVTVNAFVRIAFMSIRYIITSVVEGSAANHVPMEITVRTRRAFLLPKAKMKNNQITSNYESYTSDEGYPSSDSLWKAVCTLLQVGATKFDVICNFCHIQSNSSEESLEYASTQEDTQGGKDDNARYDFQPTKRGDQARSPSLPTDRLAEVGINLNEVPAVRFYLLFAAPLLMPPLSSP